MLEGNLLNFIQKQAEKVFNLISEYLSVIGSVRELILEQFGQNGLIAAYIVLAVLTVLIIWQLAKITFATVKYLIIPAVALAVLGSFLLPYSFFIILPATVTACSLLLLFRG